MSIFYWPKDSASFPIPLIAFEHFERLSQAHTLEEAAYFTLRGCCGIQSPGTPALHYFFQKLQEVRPKKDPSEAKTPSRSLGTSFNKFLLGIPPDRLLLMACSFDFVKAEHLYAKVDFSVAVQAIEDYLNYLQESNLYQFESVMYGTGNRYSEDAESSETAEYDLTSASAAEIMNLFK